MAGLSSGSEMVLKIREHMEGLFPLGRWEVNLDRTGPDALSPILGVRVTLRLRINRKLFASEKVYQNHFDPSYQTIWTRRAIDLIQEAWAAALKWRT